MPRVRTTSPVHQSPTPTPSAEPAPVEANSLALSMIQALIPLGLQAGSVFLADQQVPIRVPRVLGGLSCRDDEAAAEAVPEAFGLTTSSVSRRFVRASAKALPTLDERRHDDAEWLVLLRDGKSFADDQVVIALGVTTTGEKRILGLVQTATETTRGCAAFLCELVERGFQTPAGLLVVLDGAKGLSAATREGFGERVPIQRGQWHKREHVLSDLPKTLHALWRRKRQGAYAKSTDGEAQRALRPLVTDLEKHNVSAAPSLEEGLDETLTLHRLDVGRPGVHLEGRRLGRPCLRTSRWRLPENVAASLVAAVIGGIDIRSLTPELRSLTP